MWVGVCVCVQVCLNIQIVENGQRQQLQQQHGLLLLLLVLLRFNALHNSFAILQQ